MSKTINIRARTGVNAIPVYDRITVTDTDAYHLIIEMADLASIPGSVILRFVRSDDVTIEHLVDPANVVGNLIYHTLSEQQTAVTGPLQMYVRIVSGETELYTAALIVFTNVVVMDGSTIVPSEDDLLLIAQTVGGETNRVAAELVREANESDRVSAEDSRTSAESGRVDAEASRVIAEGLREQAETDRLLAENGRYDAEYTRWQAEQDRISAESARVSAESSRVSAESARVTAETRRALWATYNAGSQYEVGNKVYYNGSSYICHTRPSVGTVPTNTSFWSIIAQQGDAGTITVGSTNTAINGLVAGDGSKISAPTSAQVGALAIPDSGNYFTTDTINGAFQQVGSQLAQKAPLNNPTFTGLITTAGQIKFPATQSASSDPNTLDDYEEGTFTPIVTSSVGTLTTYTSSGKYTKIGNVVHVFMRINIIDIGTGGGELIAIMPFAPAHISSGSCREIQSAGFSCAVDIRIDTNECVIVKYDGITCIAPNRTFVVHATYGI